MRTASLIAKHPSDSGDCFRDDLNLLVVDFLRSVRGPVIIHVQPDGEECDRDAHLGEVVMIAAVEDALAVRSGAEVIVRRVGSGRVVEMIQL